MVVRSVLIDTCLGLDGNLMNDVVSGNGSSGVVAWENTPAIYCHAHQIWIGSMVTELVYKTYSTRYHVL